MTTRNLNRKNYIIHIFCKTLLFIFILFSQCSTAQSNVNTILEKINSHLKVFDNGYYGNLVIKDGYLFNYFKNAKNYRKIKLADINEVKVMIPSKKIALTCKLNNECIFSTFTNSYYKEFTFSESSGVNIDKLINLLNEFIAENNKHNYDNLKSNINVTQNNTTTNKSKDSTIDKDVNTGDLFENVKKAFEELNEHIVKLDGGRYHGMEIKDGYLYSHYENNNYSKARLEDMDYVKANGQYNYVKLGCANNQKCVYSTITGSNHDYFNFNTSASTIDKTERLLNNFLTALKAKLKGDNFTNNSKNTQQTPLAALNEYLKIYNASTYKDVTIEGNDVVFHFSSIGGNYASKISKANLKNNTTIEDVSHNTIKIICKNNASHFYSTYDDEYKDHFQFFTYNSKADKAKLKSLIEAFITSL